MGLSDMDRFRPSRREVRAFYSSPEWRHVREVAIFQQGRVCARCGASKRIEVDHVVPVRACWAGRLDPRNLQVLCRRCHAGKRREERSWPN